MYSEELIKKAKNNKEAYGLIEDEELKGLLCKESENLEFYYPGEWRKKDSNVIWRKKDSNVIWRNIVYRLNPDYEQEKPEPKEATFEVNWNIHPSSCGTEGRAMLEGCDVSLNNLIFQWRGKTYRLKYFEFEGTVFKSGNPILLRYSNNDELNGKTYYATHGVYEVLNV